MRWPVPHSELDYQRCQLPRFPAEGLVNNVTAISSVKRPLLLVLRVF